MFKPNFQFNKVTDISVSFLQENGITALLLDVDNTIITFKGNKLIAGFKEWKENLEANGIELLILSNGKSERLKQTAKKAELNFLPMALKPLPFKYHKAIRLLNHNKQNTAIVGDQIFTDILGGNLVGITTILLKPIKLEDGASFKVRRYFENKLLNSWERKA